MLKARVQVWLESKLNDDGIMMAVNMGVHSVKPLKNLANEDGKCLRKFNA